MTICDGPAIGNVFYFIIVVLVFVFGIGVGFIATKLKELK
jgi:hypothetical protein